MDEIQNSMRRDGLVRARNGKMVAGVCAGLARRYGVSANVVRAVFILSMFLPGPQILIYVALWVLIPQE